MPLFLRLASLGLCGVFCAADGTGGGSVGDGGVSNPGGTTPPTATPPANPPATPPAGDGDNSVIQQMRAQIDAANKAAKEAQDKLAAIDREKAKAEEEAAKKRGDFEKLANDRQAEIDRLKAEIAKRDMDALRVKIGEKHKLPESVVSLLPDGTEAEMEARAAALAKDLGAPAAPDTDAGKGNNPKPGASDPAAPAGSKPDSERKQTYRFQSPGDVSW